MIVVALAIIVVLLAWSLADAPRHWALKAGLSLVVLLTVLAVWPAVNSFKGWPTTDSPPHDALFVAGIVREPSAVDGDRGAIYIWLVPSRSGRLGGPLGHTSNAGEPRAYALPYTRATHEEVINAQRLQHGPHGEMRQVALHFKKGRRSRNGRKVAVFHPYILPPAGLPDKENHS